MQHFIIGLLGYGIHDYLCSMAQAELHAIFSAGELHFKTSFVLPMQLQLNKSLLMLTCDKFIVELLRDASCKHKA
jgi:hypothetical protein